MTEGKVMIGASEIDAAAGWMFGDQRTGDGSRFAEWGRARSVDIDALSDRSDAEARAAILRVRRIGQGELLAEVRAALSLAFVAGLEAERSRRDAEHLPNPDEAVGNA